MEEKTLFDDMVESGSKLPDMVKQLTANGWKTKNHHDNWVHSDWEGEYSTHEAFKRIVTLVDITKVKDFDTEEFLELSNNIGVQFIQTEIPFVEALKVVCDTLNRDPELYRAYKDNIAMAFKDCMEQAGVHSSDPENHSILVTRYMLHEIANQAAKNFLDLLIK